jgi:DNA polymerase-4
MGVLTVGALRAVALAELERRFGRYGLRLHELARGIDERAVTPDQPTQSISAEDTFANDLLLHELAPHIERLAEKTWAAAKREERRVGRTVVLKLKTADFRILTRSFTPPQPPANLQELTAIALELRERVALSPNTRYRLVGVGLSNFRDADASQPQPELFD